MNSALELKTVSEMQEVSQALAKSGYFTDANDAAKAFVKVLAGKELGFPAFSSMTGIHIIKGKPTVGANLMAAAIKRSDKYDYRVKVLDDTKCELIFFEGGKEAGTSSFTLDDAEKAGTQNTQKFPRNMLFARALSNGVRWYTPDLFLGAAVYTPEEFDTVDVDFKPTEEKPIEAPKTEPKPPRTTKPKEKRNLSDKQAHEMHKRLGAMKIEDHNALASVVVGREVKSLKEITVEEAQQLQAIAQSVVDGKIEFSDNKLVNLETGDIREAKHIKGGTIQEDDALAANEAFAS